MNLKDVSMGTWMRTLTLLIALVNQILVARGKSILPFESEDVALVVSTVFTFAASIIAWWKNNSFTLPAQKADEVLKNEKAQK